MGHFTRKDLVREGIQLVLLVGALAFLGQQLASSWEPLRALLSRIHFAWLVVAFACSLASYGTDALAWRTAYGLYARPARPVGFWAALSFLNVSGLLKYLPGKVWPYFSQFHMASQRGFDRESLVHTTIACNVGSLVVSLVAASALQPGALAAIPVLLAVILLISFSRGWTWLMSLAARRWKLKPSVTSASALLPVIGYYLGSWALLGASGVAVIVSLGGSLPFSDMLLVTAALAVGWVATLIAFVVPGGLGVREGVIFLILKQKLGPEVALAVPLVTRVILVLCDLVTASFGSARARRASPKVNS